MTLKFLLDFVLSGVFVPLLESFGDALFSA
jgi:hypothetical protein